MLEVRFWYFQFSWDSGAMVTYMWFMLIYDRTCFMPGRCMLYRCRMRQNQWLQIFKTRCTAAISKKWKRPSSSLKRPSPSLKLLDSIPFIYIRLAVQRMLDVQHRKVPVAKACNSLDSLLYLFSWERYFSTVFRLSKYLAMFLWHKLNKPIGTLQSNGSKSLWLLNRLHFTPAYDYTAHSWSLLYT